MDRHARQRPSGSVEGSLPPVNNVTSVPLSPGNGLARLIGRLGIVHVRGGLAAIDPLFPVVLEESAEGRVYAPQQFKRFAHFSRHILLPRTGGVELSRADCAVLRVGEDIGAALGTLLGEPLLLSGCTLNQMAAGDEIGRHRDLPVRLFVTVHLRGEPLGGGEFYAHPKVGSPITVSDVQPDDLVVTEGARVHGVTRVSGPGLRRTWIFGYENGATKFGR